MLRNVKRKHKPLVFHRRISYASAFVLLAAFILVLLVALSLPIIKAVYLLTVKSTNNSQPATNLATELRFGVWGVCATGELDQPGLFTNDGLCFGPKLGYDIPPELLSLIGVSQSLADAILKSLLVILVLHPIAAGLSLAALVPSLFLGSHGMAILALLFAIITALVGSIVFAIDLALVLTAKSKVKSLTEFQLAVSWGNGVWMVLASVILTWIAVILLSARACYCCGVRRRNYEDDDDDYPRHHRHDHHHHRHNGSYDARDVQTNGIRQNNKDQ